MLFAEWVLCQNDLLALPVAAEPTSIDARWGYMTALRLIRFELFSNKFFRCLLKYFQGYGLSLQHISTEVVPELMTCVVLHGLPINTS